MVISMKFMPSMFSIISNSSTYFFIDRIILFLIIIRILLRRFAGAFQDSGIFCFCFFFAKADQLNRKKPIVAIIKKKEHFVAGVFPNFRDFRFLHAFRAGWF